GAAAKVVEVMLRDEGGGDVVFAMPAETWSIENASLQFDQSDGAEAQLPESARRVKKIEMRGQARCGNGVRHSEAIIKQRPVEGFAVESDEDGALRNARGEFVKERVRFREIAHEEWFDLKAAGVPPSDAYQKWIGARAASKAGCLRVQEKPFSRIAESDSSAARDFGITCARKKFESDSGRLGKFRGREPVSNGEVFAELILGHACSEKMRERILLIRRSQSYWARRREAHGTQRSES